MALVVEQKNNNILGYRTVVHLPGGINCVNCYITKSCPCNKCSELDYETKRFEMSWDEFKSSNNKNVLMVVCRNRIPNSYSEFCQFFDEELFKSIINSLTELVNNPIVQSTQEFDLEECSETDIIV